MYPSASRISKTARAELRKRDKEVAAASEKRQSQSLWFETYRQVMVALAIREKGGADEVLAISITDTIEKRRPKSHFAGYVSVPSYCGAIDSQNPE